MVLSRSEHYPVFILIAISKEKLFFNRTGAQYKEFRIITKIVIFDSK
jgi:hypothetical protein